MSLARFDAKCWLEFTRRLGALILVVAATSSAGCGSKIQVVPVTGVVTFNGNPVKKAEVCFIREGNAPHGDPAPPAIAVTDAEGAFSLTTGELSGAVPGHYRVTVQKTNFEDLNIPDPLPKPYRKKDVVGYMMANKLVVYKVLPEVYSDMRNSPLSADVTPDETKNVFRFELEGEAPKPPSQSASPGRR
jgi:hypothetical protein